jgi:alpha-L-fucosidase 2
MLDISNGIHFTRFSVEGNEFETSVFCSFPDQVCVYTVQTLEQLPPLEVSLYNDLIDSNLHNLTCGLGHVRMRGLTQLGPPEGMRYDSIARVVSSTGIKTSCANGTSILSIIPKSGIKSVSIIVGAETNYDDSKGTAQFGYSFRGEDPSLAVEDRTRKAATKTPFQLKDAHVKDSASLTSRFELHLPDSTNSSQTQTAELIARYNAANATDNPYLENLLFDYANYLFISSSRPGSLPPNLQDRWSENVTASWSADYHANISVQMNHWTADQTGLTDLQSPLWD